MTYCTILRLNLLHYLTIIYYNIISPDMRSRCSLSGSNQRPISLSTFRVLGKAPAFFIYFHILQARSARTSYGQFPKFHSVFVGPRPWHIEIRHRVKTNIHNEFVRIGDSHIEISKIEIMETDRIQVSQSILRDTNNNKQANKQPHKAYNQQQTR